MKTSYYSLITAGFLLFIVSPANAKGEVAVRNENVQKCAFQENVNISINFNLMAEGFAQAKVKYDEKIQSISEYAKKHDLKKFAMQSLSYNINNNNGNNGSYSLNGGANYQLGNTDEAFKFADFLTQQKLNVSVNGNSYKNGVCADSQQIYD